MAAQDTGVRAPAQGVGKGGWPHVSARDWWIIGLLLAFFTLNFADKAAIGLAAHDIKRDLGLSETQYGLISSGFFWLFAVGAVVVTLTFRRIGWRWAATLLMLAWVISMAPLMFPTTLAVLLVSRMVLGFFEGPAHALCQSIVADKFPPHTRAFAGSIINSGASVGPLLGAPLLTWAMLTWDWHAAFVALVVVGLAWVVVWLLVTRRASGMGPQRAAATDGEAAADPNGDIDVPFSSMLRLGSFWGLASLSFAGYLITSLKVAWLPSFLHEGMGYSQGTVGWLVTVPYALAVVVVTTPGLISGRMLRAGRSARASRGLLTMGYLCGRHVRCGERSVARETDLPASFLVAVPAEQFIGVDGVGAPGGEYGRSGHRGGAPLSACSLDPHVLSL
ncbi:MFS transporter [Streptomyces fractus]|uniref:MFS transporter n=1 Tax=Streptomyces fractus TaxID=641806 RepID=UPI003CEA5C5C